MLILKLFDFVAGKIRCNTNVASAQPETSVVLEHFMPGKMPDGKDVEPIKSSCEKCACATSLADWQEESFEEPEFEEHRHCHSKRNRRSRKLRVDEEGWTRSERRDERRRHRSNKDSDRLSKAERRALVGMGLYYEC